MDLTTRIVNYFLSKDKKSIHKELHSVSKEFLNKNLGVNDCFLSLAVKLDDYDIIKLMIEKGANVNGITPDGVVYNIPSVFLYKSKNFEKIIKLFLKNGFDLNQTGISGDNLLSSILKDIFSDPYDTFQKIIIICAKGANPNIPEEFPPINLAIEEYLSSRDESYFQIISALLFYGANPTRKDTFGKNAYDLINGVKTLNFIKEDTEQLLNNCNNPILIKSLAISHKVKFSDDILYNDKELTRVCNCIKQVRQYLKKDTKFLDKITSRRQLVSEIKSPNNETTLLGDSIYEFTNNELFILKEQKMTWVFHVSELPTIIKSKTNPYTNIIISEENIEKMIDRNVYVYSTLQEALIYKTFEIKSNFDRFQLLIDYIYSYNTYIQTEKIKELDSKLTYQLIFLTMPYIQYQQYEYYREYLLSEEKYKEKLYDLFKNRVLNALRQRIINLPTIANIVEQVLSDKLIVDDLRSQIDIKELLIKNPRIVTYSNIVQTYSKGLDIKKIIDDKARDIAISSSELWENIKYML